MPTHTDPHTTQPDMFNQSNRRHPSDTLQTLPSLQTLSRHLGTLPGAPELMGQPSKYLTTV